MTGLDLGDDEGIHSEDDLVERMREGLEQREAARAARASRRHKSAAQQKREAEAQQAAQSLREIVRKLASALHPDREPDAAAQDAHARRPRGDEALAQAAQTPRPLRRSIAFS
jgi:hypothetical protein